MSSVVMKSLRVTRLGTFPWRLAEGVSQPPWSWRAAALAVVIAFGGFKALLYTSLRTCLGITFSSVITAAVFTGLHHPDSIPMAGANFVPAVLCSLWYERTRSLWPNIIAHSLHNLSVTLVACRL